MSNQDILNAIAGIAARLSKLEVAVTGKSGGSAGAEEEEKAPQVEAFEAFNADKVKAFADACNAIGLEGMSKQVIDGFNNMGTLIDMGSNCFIQIFLDEKKQFGHKAGQVRFCSS